MADPREPLDVMAARIAELAGEVGVDVETIDGPRYARTMIEALVGQVQVLADQLVEASKDLYAAEHYTAESPIALYAQDLFVVATELRRWQQFSGG